MLKLPLLPLLVTRAYTHTRTHTHTRASWVSFKRCAVPQDASSFVSCFFVLFFGSRYLFSFISSTSRLLRYLSCVIFIFIFSRRPRFCQRSRQSGKRFVLFVVMVRDRFLTEFRSSPLPGYLAKLRSLSRAQHEYGRRARWVFSGRCRADVARGYTCCRVNSSKYTREGSVHA